MDPLVSNRGIVMTVATMVCTTGPEVQGGWTGRVTIVTVMGSFGGSLDF